MLLIISEWVSFSHVLWQKLACCTDNAFYCTSANSVNMKKDVNRTCYINPAKLYILAQLEYDCTYLHTNNIEYIAYDVDLILNIYFTSNKNKVVRQLVYNNILKTLFLCDDDSSSQNSFMYARKVFC